MIVGWSYQTKIVDDDDDDDDNNDDDDEICTLT